MSACRYPMACTLCGARVRNFSRNAAGWKRFTGYMDTTVRFCPACRRVHGDLIRLLRVLANVPPAPPARRHPMHELLQTSIEQLTHRTTRAAIYCH